MALKQDAENVREMADRIVRIIAFAQQSSVLPDENPDLEITITAAQKQQLQNKVATLQANIKAIVGAW